MSKVRNDGRPSQKIRILHILANSRPDLNGYAIRSHDLLKAQSMDDTVIPFALTSPWYPERRSMSEVHEVDDIQYSRCIHPGYLSSNKGLGLRWVAWRGRKKIPPISESEKSSVPRKKAALPYRIYMFASKPARKFLRMSNAWMEEKILFRYFKSNIKQMITEVEPEIIHAHTPYRVGMPAMSVAKELGIPFVYEMRGIWEDTAVANGRWRNGGFAYSRFKRMENKVLRNADRVFCISETLREDAIARGVNEELITVVNNAVNESMFKDYNLQEIEGFQETEKQLNKNENTTVIGYIGSIQPLEGLDILATSIAELKARGRDVRLLIISGEKGQAELREKCQTLGLEDISLITGPFPREVIGAFYRLIDIFGVCRPPGYRVTELVTPLKPFEAMSAGIPIVVSDIPALKEIVKHEKTGLNFIAGNITSLADNIERLMDDEQLRNKLRENAIQWIKNKRTWEKVVKKSINGYHGLLGLDRA